MQTESTLIYVGGQTHTEFTFTNVAGQAVGLRMNTELSEVATKRESFEVKAMLMML